MKRIFLVTLIFLISIAHDSAAQNTSGNIEGRVTGPDGAPIDGALVEVTGPALQGARQFLTHDNGLFLVPDLRVGSYILAITHDLYAETRLPGIPVSLGTTNHVGDVQLTMQATVIETMIVTARAPLIDPASAAAGGNLTDEEFSDLPVDRDYKRMALLLPHSSPSYLGDDDNLAGATGLGNRYFIDGVDVTDPNQGNGGSALPYNFINEVRVRTGGYEAEYRSAFGGILEAVTRSGSNDFHGQVFGFFTNSGLTSTAESNVFIDEPGDFTAYDYGFGLGGPIIRDKLWFYGALNPTRRTEDITIPGVGIEQDALTVYRFATKLDWRVNESNDLVLSVFGDPGGGDAVWLHPITTVVEAENADPFLYEATSGGINAILEGKHWLSDQFLLRSSVALVSNKRILDPRTTRGREELLYIDAETGTWSGGTPGNIDKQATTITAGLHGTLIRDRHTWKAGLEYRSIQGKTDEGMDYLARYADDDWLYVFNESDGEAGITVPTVYLQDSWRVSEAFRLNLGLRWDGQIVSADGETAVEILDQWQPRLGFTYQLGSQESQQIFGSAGRFYQELSLNLATNQYSESNRWGIVEYDHDPRQDPSGGTTTEWAGYIPDDIGMQGQHYDEFTLGYERRLGEASRIRLRGIYRTLRRGIEDSYSSELDDFVIGNPGYGPLTNWDPMTRDYSALELTYRIIKTRYSARAAYVLSKNEGNYTGLFDSENNMMFPNLTTAFDDPETMPNNLGLLANDRTHVFKLSGSYRWDFGFSLGTFFTWMSGTPLNEFGTTSWHYHSYLVERGSAGRTPDIWSFNVRLAWRFRSSAPEGLRPRLIVDLMNIGSSTSPVNIDQLHYFDGGETNPTYGVATGFQPPMSVRLGLEVDF